MLLLGRNLVIYYYYFFKATRDVRATRYDANGHTTNRNEWPHLLATVKIDGTFWLVAVGCTPEIASFPTAILPSHSQLLFDRFLFVFISGSAKLHHRKAVPIISHLTYVVIVHTLTSSTVHTILSFSLSL